MNSNPPPPPMIKRACPQSLYRVLSAQSLSAVSVVVLLQATVGGSHHFIASSISLFLELSKLALPSVQLKDSESPGTSLGINLGQAGAPLPFAATSQSKSAPGNRGAWGSFTWLAQRWHCNTLERILHHPS